MLRVSLRDHAVLDFDALVVERDSIATLDLHLVWDGILQGCFEVAIKIVLFVRDGHWVSNRPEDNSDAAVLALIAQDDCIFEQVFLSDNLNDAHGQR